VKRINAELLRDLKIEYTDVNEFSRGGVATANFDACATKQPVRAQSASVEGSRPADSRDSSASARIGTKRFPFQRDRDYDEIKTGRAAMAVIGQMMLLHSSGKCCAGVGVLLPATTMIVGQPLSAGAA